MMHGYLCSELEVVTVTDPKTKGKNGFGRVGLTPWHIE